jgi:uncharacterized protein YuzE
MKMEKVYDAEADVLYVNFKKPSCATDSEMTDDDIIIRYEGEEVIGFTILHASRTMPTSYEPGGRRSTKSLRD